MDTLAKTLINSAEIKKARGAREELEAGRVRDSERAKLVLHPRIRIPSRTHERAKVQTNLFDPPNERRLGGRLASPSGSIHPMTTIPPSDSPDPIFSQPSSSARQRVHCSRIWRRSKRTTREKSFRSDPRFSLACSLSLGLFILSLLVPHSFRITIFAHEGRRRHNEYMQMRGM